MSGMGCRCGGVISDVLVPCPTEGLLYRDQDLDEYYDGACRDIAAFCAAVRDGRRDEWLEQFFDSNWWNHLENEVIVHDIMFRHVRKFALSVAECAQCGRLYVQQNNGVNFYLSYAPDEPGYAGVLRAAKDRPT